MAKKINYLFKPRDGISIDSYREIGIKYPNNESIKIREPFETGKKNGLFTLNLKSGEKPIKILRRMLGDQIVGQDKYIHRVVLEDYFKESSGEDEAAVYLFPDGRSFYETEVFGFDSEIGAIINPRTTFYSVDITDNPKKKDKGIRSDTFLSIFNSLFPIGMQERKRELHGFAVRVNINGCCGEDLKIIYRQNSPNDELGTVIIKSNFSRAKKMKKRNRNSEKVLFFEFLKDFFEIREENLNQEKLSLEELTNEIHDGLNNENL